MSSGDNDTYPRPDFVRSQLNWQSLNGIWDLLFDDEDAGLNALWHRQGLPNEVQVRQKHSYEDGAPESESDDITAKIAANPQNLIRGNLVHQAGSATINRKRKIKVPYVFQSVASGLHERAVHEVLWYERVIRDHRTKDEKERNFKLLLRCGAIDYEATVWLNGEYVGRHRGGHVPFDLDITDAVQSSNRDEHRITIRIYDSAYDLTQPRGKQYWGAKPESIFYTPSSGIWQSVWLESVPPARIADSSHGTILRSNDIESGNLHATIALLGRRAGHGYAVEVEGSYRDILIKKERKALPKETDRVSISLNLRLSQEQKQEAKSSGINLDDHSTWRDGLALWSPDSPQMYTIRIRLLDNEHAVSDEVETTVGMRSLNWITKDSRFLLNDQPLFQILNLDQGYWPDTLMTPPTSSALKEDIEMAKRMGFNGCRKHQKVEDPLFLYWADRLGYLVWGEMASAYKFSEQCVDRFNQEWVEAVKRDINHPCIVAWTLVNESWGYTDLSNNVEQRNHIRALYHLTKTLDPTRPINDNCGWEHVITDLTTFHDYADSDALTITCSSLEGILGPKAERFMFTAPIPDRDDGAAHKEGAVVLCTEFGGVNIAPSGQTGHKDEWGYTTAADSADLLNRVEKLVNAVVDGGHCAGFVWTQFSDIEQETNGLYSFDRKEKLDAAKVKGILDRAKERYYSGLVKSQ